MTSSKPDQRVGIYLRVSTLNQETENQLLQLRVLCEQQGRQSTKEYVDVESGRKGKRERSDLAQFFKDPDTTPQFSKARRLRRGV